MERRRRIEVDRELFGGSLLDDVRCYGCSGGHLPGPVDAKSGCGLTRRPFHTLLIVTAGESELWQTRVMAHHWRLQASQDPCAEMGNLSRLLILGQERFRFNPREVSTVTAKSTSPERSRPDAIVQYIKGGHLDQMREDYVLIAEPDQVFLRPLPNLASETVPAAFRVSFMKQKPDLVDRVAPGLGLGRKTQPVGPSPLLIHKEQLRQLAPLWLKFTDQFAQEPSLARAVQGWRREYWGYAIAAAQLGISHLILDAFQFESSTARRGRRLAWPVAAMPASPEGPLLVDDLMGLRGSSFAPRMPYYMLHFDQPLDYSREGLSMGRDGEWSFDKRHYRKSFPPRQLWPPPRCAPGHAHLLTSLINNASAKLRSTQWSNATDNGSLWRQHSWQSLRAPAVDAAAMAVAEADEAPSWAPKLELFGAWRDASIGRIIGTGPWRIRGNRSASSDRPIVLEQAYFLSHGYLATSRGQGRWAVSSRGGAIDVEVCGVTLRLKPRLDVSPWELREGVLPACGCVGVTARLDATIEGEVHYRWSLPVTPPSDELSRRLEGTGPYIGPAGEVYLLRGGALQATGDELGAYRRWRLVPPACCRSDAKARLVLSKGRAEEASKEVATGAAKAEQDESDTSRDPSAQLCGKARVCAILTECFTIRLPTASQVRGRGRDLCDACLCCCPATRRAQRTQRPPTSQPRARRRTRRAIRSRQCIFPVRPRRARSSWLSGRQPRNAK